MKVIVIFTYGISLKHYIKCVLFKKEGFVAFVPRGRVADLSSSESRDIETATELSVGTALSSVSFPVSRPDNYWINGIVYGVFGHKWTAQGAKITQSTAQGELTISDKTNILPRNFFVKLVQENCIFNFFLFRQNTY